MGGGEGGESCLRFLVYWGGVRWVVRWEVVVDETVMGMSWQETSQYGASIGKERLQIACSLCSRRSRQHNRPHGRAN